ncbi:hypothetical protein BGZ68_010609 [Mortierella alpina]|nr:hypothetical protein BGZ68_010609 [Mortierella alpina]
MSALLCLAATAAAATIPCAAHDRAASNPLEKRDGMAAALQSNGDINYAAPKHKRHAEHSVEAHKDGKSKDDNDDNDEDNDEDEEKKKDDGGNKKGGNDGKKSGGKKPPAGKPPAGKAPADKGPGGKDGAKTVPGKGVTAPNTNANEALTHDASSPIWIVQPFGQSVWEQGRAYEIRWGPNPNGEYAKALKPNSPVDISLMQGPPGNLKEVAVLKKAANEATHKFKWIVPASVPVATNYAIRVYRNKTPVDTYSHYFEIVKAGDPRSSKSNVGDPEELPQKGDAPMPLNKGPGPKPPGPPNPPPPAPAAAKPIPSENNPTLSDTAKKPKHSGASVRDVKGANVLAFAMALFCAVYFL